MSSNSDKRLKIDDYKVPAISEPSVSLSDPETCRKNELKIFFSNSWARAIGIKTSDESVYQCTDFPNRQYANKTSDIASQLRSSLSDYQMHWNREVNVVYNNSRVIGITTTGESTMERKLNCHMCGGSGHQAIACPNAICLTVRF